MAFNEYDMIINIRSDFDKELNKLDKQLEKVGVVGAKAADKLEDGFDKASDSSKKFGETNKKTMSSMEKNVKKATDAMQAAMASVFIKTGTDAIKRTEKLDAAFAVLKARSSDVANQLENIGDATFGLANKYDLLNSTNEALNLGIDLSNGRLTEMVKLTNKLAQSTGIDANNALQSLTLGVAKNSAQRLDELGIVLDLNEVYQEYADRIGETVDSLSKQQQQNALMEASLDALKEKTKDTTDEMIKQYTRGTAAIKRFETAVTTSTGFIARGFVKVGDSIGETVSTIFNASTIIEARLMRQRLISEGILKGWTETIVSDFTKLQEKIDKEVPLVKGFTFTEKDVKAIEREVKKETKAIAKARKDAAMVFRESDANKIERELKKESMGILGGVKDFQKQFDKDEEERERTYQARLEWNQQTQKMLDDFAAKEKRRDAEARAKRQKHFDIMKSYGSEYLNAIFQGQLDMIPKILAQQAMMFGQEMIWDGIKTIWMGTAKNALFPGLGASAVTVGVAEIAAGTALATAGGLAANALGDTPSNSDGGASERASTSNREQEINLNVTTSLYGNKKEAQRQVRGLL